MWEHGVGDCLGSKHSSGGRRGWGAVLSFLMKRGGGEVGRGRGDVCSEPVPRRDQNRGTVMRSTGRSRTGPGESVLIPMQGRVGARMERVAGGSLF